MFATTDKGVDTALTLASLWHMIGHAATAAIFPWHIASSYLTVVAKILSLKAKNIYSYFGFYLKNVVFDAKPLITKIICAKIFYICFFSYYHSFPQLYLSVFLSVCLSFSFCYCLMDMFLIERITIVNSGSCWVFMVYGFLLVSAYFSGCTAVLL